MMNVEFLRKIFYYKVLLTPRNMPPALIFENCESIKCSVRPNFAFHYLFNTKYIIYKLLKTGNICSLAS